MEANYSLAPPVEAEGAPRPGQLLRNVHRLYRGQFWRWFGITAPTSLLASFVLLIANRQLRAMGRNIPRDPLQFQFKLHAGEIVGIYVLRFGSFFLTWFLGCFALAAIATVVNEPDTDDTDTAWRNDSHHRAREHFGALVLAALWTFCAFLAGMAAAEFVDSAAVRLMGWSRFLRFNYGATLVEFVLVAAIVSWLGMAIPLIVRGNTTVWAALKRSVQLSNGNEGSLLLLVVHSLLGSYLAWYAALYSLRLLVPDYLRHTPWYGWFAYVVGILVTAAVEPPIFIGFSLLAAPEPPTSSPLPGPQ